MRSSFYEYYVLSKEEENSLWDNALLVLDTNVLLSLYRLQRDARQDILSALEKYKERLWLPNQVGWEFHEHRIEEACRPLESLKQLKEKVSGFVSDIENNYSKHPYLKDYKSLKRSLSSFSDKVAKRVDDSLNECPKYLQEDEILNEVSVLYDGRVGKSYSDDRLSEIYKIGEGRYQNKIPPGYKDKEKKTGPRHQFGDLIIWQQILEKAKESSCDIIFVTDDKKEDWWQLHKGDKLGPRRELIAEFMAYTGNHLIWFYTPDRFFSIANQRKAITVRKTTIDEMRDFDSNKIGMEPLLGESIKPGMFSSSSLNVDSKNKLGESNLGKRTSSALMDEASDFSNRNLSSHFAEDSPSLSLGLSSNPSEFKDVPLGDDSSNGDYSLVGENETRIILSLGDGEEDNDSNNEKSN